MRLASPSGPSAGKVNQALRQVPGKPAAARACAAVGRRAFLAGRAATGLSSLISLGLGLRGVVAGTALGSMLSNRRMPCACWALLTRRMLFSQRLLRLLGMGGREVGRS
jgi:hypothetical protein